MKRTLEQTLEFMRQHPWNWYYVCNDAWGGVGTKDWEEYSVRRERLDYIGSDICTMNIHNFWVGIDKYDFDGVD